MILMWASFALLTLIALLFIIVPFLKRMINFHLKKFVHMFPL